jgi:hypothetical protein
MDVLFTANTQTKNFVNISADRKVCMYVVVALDSCTTLHCSSRCSSLPRPFFAILLLLLLFLLLKESVSVSLKIATMQKLVNIIDRVAAYI